MKGSVLEKMKAIKEAGFEGVEMMSHMDQEEVLRARDEAGLMIPSVCGSMHWQRPLSDPDPKVREQGLDGLRQRLRDAKRYGATSVLLVPAVVKREVSYEEAYTRSQAEIRKAIPLAEELQGLAPLLIADDPALAAEIGAAGLHLPEVRMREVAHWRARFPNWIITSSAHSLRALMAAAMLDAVFLSPVFAGHKQTRPLTPVRAAFIAARALVPVYALGGINPRNAALLAPSFSGIAAIGSLI